MANALPCWVVSAVVQSVITCSFVITCQRPVTTTTTLSER